MRTKEQETAYVLGLAQKAGKLASGDYAVKAAFEANSVKLLIIAADAAPNTVKKLHSLAETAGVEIVETMTSAEISSAIGKEGRMSAAILDANFVNLFLLKVGGEKNGKTCL